MRRHVAKLLLLQKADQDKTLQVLKAKVREQAPISIPRRNITTLMDQEHPNEEEDEHNMYNPMSEGDEQQEDLENTNTPHHNYQTESIQQDEVEWITPKPKGKSLMHKPKKRTSKRLVTKK